MIPLTELCRLAAAMLGLGCLLIIALNCVHGMRFNCKGLNLISLVLLSLGVTLGYVVLWPWIRGVQPWLSGTGWFAPVLEAVCLATALVGLPLVTLRRSLRGQPHWVDSREEGVVRLQGTDASNHGVGWRTALMKLPGNQAIEFTIRDATVTCRPLPLDLDGLQILVLGDLHLIRAYPREYFERVIDEAAALPADLILFTGDLLDDPACYAWVKPLLGRLHAPLGRYAVLGNHDYLRDPDRAAEALQEAGFTMIQGRWEVIERGCAQLALGGTAAPWGPALDHAARPAADATIVLSHSPDTVYDAARLEAHLMVCGHNHGGQVRLPVLGPIVMPSRYSRRFDQGFFQVGPTQLYVSPGLGSEVPLRWRCRPELMRLTLRGDRPAAGSLTAAHATNRAAEPS